MTTLVLVQRGDPLAVGPMNLAWTDPVTVLALAAT